MPVQALESGEAAIINTAAEAVVKIRFIAFKFKFTAKELARSRPYTIFSENNYICRM
jgi:hypothetical protein